MKKILSVFMALCTVLTTLCIPPAPVTAQSTEMLISDQIDETVTLPVEEEPITLETLTEDCKILQYVDEEAFAAADHAFRLPYLEELDTYVFQNTDGTRSIYYLYENVKYIDEQGNIREKDNALQRETKGFRITENEFDLLLPHAITDGVELTYQGYDVKLIPATEGKLTATALGALRENSVVYESFFGAGTSLVYTPLLSGVKEEIILEEYLPNQSFSFLLYTDGLFLNNTDGSYILTESKASAEAVLYLGDIVVYDAVGRPSLGNLAVETVKDGNIYALTVSADEAFLSDPATVYPVTIDPDITVSDANNGSGAIEDTTLFSGTPNLNTGDWVYNTAGYVDETYGAGRILVRLPGLYNDEVYQGLTADRILSATFYTTKSSSKVPDYVNLYLCTDTAWSENSVAWNYHANLYTNSTNWGTSSVSSSAVTFNITSLVKAWRSGTYSAQAGFMLVNQNETDVTKKFGIYSSEHSNTEKRPYFVLNYEADIVLDKAELEVKLGTFGTLNATATPANQQVYWRSSNEAVASVTPSGVVAPHHAGTTTITAWFTDSDGVDHEATCNVTVYLPNAVYYVQNTNSLYYLNTKNAGVSQGTDVNQLNKYTTAEPTKYNLAQMWRFFYLGDGRYSIRPMHKLDMGLDVYGGNVVLEPIGTSDTQAGVPDYCEWVLEWDSTGYLFRNNGFVSRTMQVKDASTAQYASVVVGAYANVANCKWSLIEITDPPAGAVLVDIENESWVDNPGKCVEIGETATLEDLGLVAVAYSGSVTGQVFAWTSSDESVVTIERNTGTITGVSPGTAVISGHVYRNSSVYYVKFGVCVGYPTLFGELVTAGLAHPDACDNTTDGLFITTTPLSSILEGSGIYTLPEDEANSKPRYVARMYDDWYLYSFKTASTEKYGLYKMREQENDSGSGYDNDDPGVTISFIALDVDKLRACFEENTVDNRYALTLALDAVTGPGIYDHDVDLVAYFSEVSSKGSYLIAEKYVAFIASQFGNGIIATPNRFNELYDEIADIDAWLDSVAIQSDAVASKELRSRREKYRRVIVALEGINAKSGKTIYDESTRTLIIDDIQNLSLYEKQAILSCFTGNVTFNSFAAEVLFHACATTATISVDMVFIPMLNIHITDFPIADLPIKGDDWYVAAIRADMGIGEENESGYFDDYYDLSSNIVQAQIEEHGEY